MVGRWSAQDLVLSATRISGIGETTQRARPFCALICACRIDSRFGPSDLFFHICGWCGGTTRDTVRMETYVVTGHS